MAKQAPCLLRYHTPVRKAFLLLLDVEGGLEEMDGAVVGGDDELAVGPVGVCVSGGFVLLIPISILARLHRVNVQRVWMFECIPNSEISNP